jgi:hypothetical protein
MRVLLATMLLVPAGAWADPCPPADASLEVISVDDSTLSFCADAVCWRLDLDGGSYQPFARPAGAESVDEGRGGDADGRYRLPSAVGGEDGSLEVLDAKTGARVAVLYPDGRGTRREHCYEATLVDGAIVVNIVPGCSEIGSDNHIVLYDPATGRRIAPLARHKVFDTWNARWVQAHDHVWAFSSADAKLALADVRTGKSVGFHDARALFGVTTRGRAKTHLVAAERRMVLLLEEPAAGAAAVLNRRTGRIEHRFTCAGR